MRAVILAAGRGRRLGGLTDERPKGLAPLHGKPLLHWQLETLREAGVEELAIVRGYRGEAFEFDVRYFDNPRWAETNMVASLAAAAEWLAQDTCLVAYADLVYPVELVRSMSRAASDIAIAYDVNWRALWTRRFAEPLSDAETFRVDAAGRLLEIGARAASLDEIEGQYMGLFRLTPAGAERFLDCRRALAPEARDAIDVTGLLARLLADGVAIEAVPYAGWWCEIDSESDLRLAAELVPREPNR